MTDAFPLSPISHADWPSEISDLQNDFAGRLNIYRTMAHHPALLRNWSNLRRHVVLENALGAERLEVAILRIGTRLESEYEWVHHVKRARAIGMEMGRIESLRGSPNNMTEADALIARAVDALIDDTCLPRETVEDLQTLVGLEGVFDLMATVGFYKTLGCIAKTFDVPMNDQTGKP